MNGPSIGRTPGQALRVYLSGEADHGWRKQILRIHQHPAFDTAITHVADDTKLSSALPLNHDYIGPYFIRPKVDYSSRPWSALPGSANSTAPYERTRMRQIGRADAVFCWIGDVSIPDDTAFELGVARELGIPYLLAAKTWTAFDVRPLIAGHAHKLTVSAEPRGAYEQAMADLDVLKKPPGIVTSKYDGKCLTCSNTYLAGHQIYWSKTLGGHHVDCYLFSQNQLHATTFNSLLVNTLREENGRLERECLELMAKNAELQKPR